MVMGTDIRAPYGMACTECNNLLVAPKSSAYVSNHEVRHVWSCENCGREVELAINLRIDGTPNRKQAKGLKRRLLHKLRRFPQDDYEARKGREDAIQCASTDAAHACESKATRRAAATRR